MKSEQINFIAKCRFARMPTKYYSPAKCGVTGYVPLALFDLTFLCSLIAGDNEN